ncbi:MAG: signal peptidase II [Kiritimatiellia bacterium]
MIVLAVSFFVALADQLTKHFVRLNLPGRTVDVIPGFFTLRYVRNTGAAWGIFEGFNNWLVLLSAVMLTAIFIFRRHLLDGTALSRLALGLMTGGIIGNLADRVRLGYVVDFLDFHLSGHHFPAFNIADAAICAGVSLYVFTQVSRKYPAKTTETP